MHLLHVTEEPGLVQMLEAAAESEVNVHLLKNILYFPLLVLKGMYHYWEIFFQGASAN